MEKKPQELRMRFRGAIVGAAVADALAFPYQHYSRAFMRSQPTPLTAEYTTHHSGFYPLGQYSDDTQLMLAVVDSIVESGTLSGADLVSHFVPLWRDNVLVERDNVSSEPMQRHIRGLAEWDGCALESGYAEVSPVTRGIGIALWRRRDPEGLCGAVEVSSIVTHRDPRVLACAAVVAAAVAHNSQIDELVLGPFLDSISSASARFDGELAEALLDFPRILSMTDQRALRHFETVRPDERYPPGEEGLGTYCIPSVWTGVYSFLKTPYDYRKAVEGCIRAGGHVDTAACIAGALAGSLGGEEQIPRELREGVLNREELERKADALFERSRQG